MRGSLGFSILVVIGLTLGLPSGAAAQPARQLLAGIWSLNLEQSDDTDELEQEAIESLPRPPGRGGVLVARPVAPTLSAGVRGGFGPPRGFDPELIRQAVAEATNAADRMIITLETADTLLLGLDGNAPYVLVVNGEESNRSWIDGANVEIKASWDGRELRIERKLENELEITRSFALDRRSRRLIVTTEVDGPIPSEIEVRHVYDRERQGPP